MGKFENFVKELNKDAKIPENIQTCMEETLSDIGNYKTKKRFGAAWVKVAAIAGAVVIGGGVFCYTNPVIASKIPVIGKIFEQVENQVEFSGNYANKETLQDEGNEKAGYTSESNGVTIKASEIYSDGYSIYLTTEVKIPQGGMKNVAAAYTSRFGETKSQYLYTEGTWNNGDVKTETELGDNGIEGSALDDNTFVGMIKLNQGEYSVEDGKLNIHLTSIGYDDMSQLKGEDKNEPTVDDDKVVEFSEIENLVTIKGDWQLSIPYTVDRENSKEIAVGKKNKDGYGIDRIFVSPYQVVVFSDIPYKKLDSKEYTEEDHKKKYGEKAEMFSYEEALEQKNYGYYELALFNQDGKYLEFSEMDQDDSASREVYSVKGLDISKLHIYMLTDEDRAFKMIKSTKEADAAKLADFDVEVDVK